MFRESPLRKSCWVASLMLALAFCEDAFENPARGETEDDCSRNWTCIGHLWQDLGVESRRSSGGEVFVQNSGHVIATFMGSSAMFDNLLLLASPISLGTIFEGHVAPSFTTVDLGIFSAGTKLIFELNNQNGRFFYWPSQPQLRQHCSRDCGLSVGAGPNFRGIRGYFRRW